MISTAHTTYTLMHGGTLAAECVSVWPQADLAQRTNNAASGV